MLLATYVRILYIYYIILKLLSKICIAKIIGGKKGEGPRNVTFVPLGVTGINHQ